MSSLFLSSAVSVGLVLLWVGERLVESGTTRGLLSGVGLLLIVAATVMRVLRRSSRDRADLKHVETVLLGLDGGVLLALLLYFLQSDAWAKVAGAQLSVGWPTLAGALGALWPAVLVTALIPTFLVELSLASMTRAPSLELGRVREAMYSGFGMASAVIFAFSLQYVAAQRDVVKDLSYFRTTKPGDATKNMVKSLDQPLEVALFFPPANEVATQVRLYFDELKEASPKLEVSMHDQALEPGFAKELSVSGNGTVVLRKGGKRESIYVGLELEKARTQLRSLDQEVQKRLLQIARARRTVYLTAGHGERLQDPANQADQRSTVDLLKRTLVDQNFEVRTLSTAEGLAVEVPKDAAAVFIIGPTQPFSEPEAQALQAYEQRGGRLFIAVDPEAGLDQKELLSPLGVVFTPVTLANDKVYARTTAQASLADRKNIGTRNYSSHPAVTYLGRSSDPVLMMGAGALDEAKPKPPNVSVDFAIRADHNTFNDVNNNFEADPTEVRQAYGLMAAVTRRSTSNKPEEELRALVLGDSDAVSDVMLTQVRGNQLLVVDGLKWLLGEEQLQGTVNSEQDAPMLRSHQQDQAWFYGSMFAGPAVVLGIGFVARRRPKKSAAAPVGGAKEAKS